MLHCPYCKVDVAGDKTCCPLCGGPLEGTPDRGSEVFPALPKSRFTGSFVLRLIALLGIAISGVCVLENYVWGSQMWWSLFVVGGAACLWLAAAIGITYRRDAMQSISWLTFLIPILSVLWDICTGWRGWSVNYVLPCVCIFSQGVMLLLALMLHLPVRNWVGYAALACLLGLSSVVLLLLGLIFSPLISLVCAGISLTFLCVLLLFHGRTFRDEFVRRFHL